MLLDAAVLAVLIGLLVGGRLTRLPELALRAVWVFITAAVVQIGLLVIAAKGVALPNGVAPALYVVSFALVLLGLWLNRRLPGVWLVLLGVLMNFVVIVANGGSMPVDRDLAVRAGDEKLVAMLDSPDYVGHMPATESTRLRPLGDVLRLPMLIPRPRFFSPGSMGDVLITVGACWLILVGMGAFGLRQGEVPGEAEVVEP
ncbi:MAG: DUF5317 domain-containing protein [Armatimonadetes bacterium]|nr:DUF5317 domain-containing protein [Armatimonadota bacterium]